jgi:hypothetical protein
MKLITILSLFLFIQCSHKLTKVPCALTPVEVEENKESLTLYGSSDTMYLTFCSGFFNTVKLQLGKRVYDNIILISDGSSGVIRDIDVKYVFKKNNNHVLMLTERNCEFAIKTELKRGYKYAYIYRERDDKIFIRYTSFRIRFR